MGIGGWIKTMAIAGALGSIAPASFAAASCDTMGGCAAKACRIDADMAQAKAKGNSKQIASLERARAEMTHCSDDGLKQKRKVALEQAQHRIDLRDADLRKAEATGDPAKIKKAQGKLDSARKSYAEIAHSPL